MCRPWWVLAPSFPAGHWSCTGTRSVGAKRVRRLKTWCWNNNSYWKLYRPGVSCSQSCSGMASILSIHQDWFWMMCCHHAAVVFVSSSFTRHLNAVKLHMSEFVWSSGGHVIIGKHHLSMSTKNSLSSTSTIWLPNWLSAASLFPYFTVWWILLS